MTKRKGRRVERADLTTIVGYCDELLGTETIGDFPGARNGLQLENSGTIARLCAAVDSDWRVLDQAAEVEHSLLIVHHGMFWGATLPWRGMIYQKLRRALDRDLAVYASHLPLDAHSEFGNNAVLARAIGLKRSEPFFEEKGSLIGRVGVLELQRDVLATRVEAAVGGPVQLVAGGPARTKRVGVVSGGCGNEIARVAATGVDTFITGEGAHWTVGLAHELKLNVVYAGHYATETFGVRALAEHVSGRFGVPWTFLDVPSGR